MAADDPLDELSDSVLRGEEIDWDRPETRTGLDPDTLQNLRDVARIAEFSRRSQRAAAPPPSAEPPGPWGDLLLLEPLGTGARGEVWRAWDPTLQRQVALKFLQGERTSDDRAVWEELLAEARALARVRHRAVVAVHGIAERDGRAGMWMECLQGLTLARELERSARLSDERVASIGLELGSALEALEAAGLVHRDIKPANIVLELDGRVVLTDFGLGWRPALDAERSTRSSGTPVFMAPEVLAGEEPSHASDLYALGVTLWWALAGRVPFQARTLRDLQAEASRGPSPTLREVCPEANASLVSAILWAMHPSAAERPPSAARFTERLRLACDEIAAARRAGPPGAAPHPASVAVLPFANRSGNPEDEYFSDGLADELIHVLSKIKGMRVAARASSFHFRGNDTRPAEIGRALRVATILDGSVRRIGDRVRISVQLVNAADGETHWSESYDRTLDDLFAVQDDIARSVVKELRSTLLGQAGESGPSPDAGVDVTLASKGRSSHAEAHRLYLLARYFLNRLNREDLTRAIQNLNEALALDPQFALAWTELGSAFTRAAGYGLLSKPEAIRQGREAVRRALEIEPDLAEAHARMGVIQMFHDWNWNEARASFARALELAPGDPVALNGAGVLATVFGHVDQSLELHRQASAQDPLNTMPHSNFGLTLFRAGRYADAELSLRKALELAPQRYVTRGLLALTLLHQDRGEEALAEAAREPAEGQRLYALAVIHHRLGHRDESDAAFRELTDRHGEDYAVQIAEVHAARGDHADTVFAWLDRAYALRDFGVTELQTNPSLRPYHGDPRWGGLMDRLGLGGERRP